MVCLDKEHNFLTFQPCRINQQLHSENLDRNCFYLTYSFFAKISKINTIDLVKFIGFLICAQNVTQYACAFADEEVTESWPDVEVETDTSTDICSDDMAGVDQAGVNQAGVDQAGADQAGVESLMPDDALPLEEAAENLEIPHLDGDTPRHINNAFYFYQGRIL